MIYDIIRTYINTCILPFDAASDGFTVMGLEQPVDADFELSDGRKVKFGGTADRIDRLADGRVRVVDYKTGREQLAFAGVESLFSDRPQDLNSGVLQTLLYSMMLARKWGDVQPSLFYVRQIFYFQKPLK